MSRSKWQCPGTRWWPRVVIGFAAVVGLAVSASARPADVDGWEATRWGMGQDAALRILGDAARDLDPPLAFGGGPARLFVGEATLGGVTLPAYLQMHPETGGLRQVLMELRPPRVTPRALADLGRYLTDRYGDPDDACDAPRAAGAPRTVDWTWRFPTTTIHLVYLDFNTPSIAYEDPNVDRDPLTPYVETRRNNPRFLPRRVLVRLHATSDADLAPRRSCAARDVPMPGVP